MQLFGLALRKPAYPEFTSASVMAVGLWLLAAGLCVRSGVPITARELSALLFVSWWSCLAVRCGLDFRHGWRAVGLQAGGTLAALGASELLWTVASPAG